MKKPKFWFILSAILVVVYLVKIPLDYHVYSTTLNSAPFWVWLLVNAVYFLIPALIALVIGWIMGRKK